MEKWKRGVPISPSEGSPYKQKSRKPLTNCLIDVYKLQSHRTVKNEEEPRYLRVPESYQTNIPLSEAPLGGTTGSWRPRQLKTGVPVGLVWVEPPCRFALLIE